MIVSHASDMSGYLRVGGDEVALRLPPVVGSSSRILYGCPRLRAALRGQEDVLRRRLSRITDNAAFLAELQDMVERGISVSPRAQLPPVRFYELLVAEIDAVGWGTLFSISPALDEVQLQLADDAGREHILTLELPPDYPRLAPRTRSTLPTPFEIVWPHDPSTGRPMHSLSTAIQRFSEALASHQVLWNMLDDIDEHVWVRLVSFFADLYWQLLSC